MAFSDSSLSLSCWSSDSSPANALSNASSVLLKYTFQSRIFGTSRISCFSATRIITFSVKCWRWCCSYCSPLASATHEHRALSESYLVVYKYVIYRLLFGGIDAFLFEGLSKVGYVICPAVVVGALKTFFILSGARLPPSAFRSALYFSSVFKIWVLMRS